MRSWRGTDGPGSMDAADTELRVFEDVEGLSAAAARALVEEAGRAIAERGRFTLALSGGKTPWPLYDRLAAEHRGDEIWRSVHLFWTDERFVPLDHPDSNAGAALTRLRPLSLPSENLHVPDTRLALPEETARRYERELRAFLPLDSALLGMGDDGHVASLFPGSPALEETHRLVVAVHHSPKPPLARISMTLPALSGARVVHFLVTGSAKREALNRVLSGADPSLPASRVRLRDGRTLFWADRAAAP